MIAESTADNEPLLKKLKKGLLQREDSVFSPSTDTGFATPGGTLARYGSGLNQLALFSLRYTCFYHWNGV